MKHATTSLLAVALAIGGGAALAQNGKSRVTSADAAKKRGLEIQKWIDADVDGDGKKEVVAMTLPVGDKSKGFQLAILAEDENGYVVRDVLPVGGKDFKRFEGMNLMPPAESAEIVVEIYDETPDEKVKRVRVFGGAPRVREIFTSVIFRAKDKDDRAEWERDPGVVQYGDARPGWYFVDLEEDGLTEILVRRKPQLIEVARKDKDPAKLLTGVREDVYAFEGGLDQGVYQKRAAERFNDFLPSYAVQDVDASSVWVEPTLLKDLKAQALSEAATAAATGKKPGEAAVDLKPFMVLGADKNLETGWVEDAKNHGKGEWLEVKLDGEREIHMVRVVPGCVYDKRSYAKHNIPETFDIQLGSGSRARVDTRKTDRPDLPAIAIKALPLKERPWAKQYLVFFEGKDTASTVRIWLDGVKKQGKGNHTCISEVSVH